ncbi:MAG: T9SS type A sorting domain-containing protein [Cytophagales bacterium]|nr:T9SS type A sorting domain-containing protein [Cytophagales bacterium]
MNYRFISFLISLLSCIISYAADISVAVGPSFAFAPSSFQITLGDKITFNVSSGSHNVVFSSVPNNADQSLVSGTAGIDHTWEFTPTVAGIYNVRCGVHSGMTASFTVAGAAAAPSISTTGVSSLTICGGNITVSYSEAGSFNPGNIFSVQLSNDNFNTTTTLSTVSTSSGSIVVAVPSSVHGNTNYRVRIVSSDPVVTSADNGSNISINYSPAADYDIDVTPVGAVCTGNTITFAGTSTNLTNPSFTWMVNGSIVGTGTNSYVSTTLQNNDIARAVITGTTQGCNSAAYSQTTVGYVLTMTSSVTPTLVIQSSPAVNLCFGATLSISGTPNGGGATPVYALYIDNVSVAGGTSTYKEVSNLTVGTHTITGTLISSLSCATVQSVTSNTLIINVVTVPSAPVITQNTLACVTTPCPDVKYLASSVVNNIQWYSDARGILTGATSASYTPTVSGVYKVVVNVGGCTATSTGFTFTYVAPTVTGIAIQDTENEKITIYPNPAKERIFVSFAGGINKNNVSIKIYDNQMNMVIHTPYTQSVCKGGKAKACLCPGVMEIGTDALSGGIYIVQIYDADKLMVTQRVVILK